MIPTQSSPSAKTEKNIVNPHVDMMYQLLHFLKAFQCQREQYIAYHPPQIDFLHYLVTFCTALEDHLNTGWHFAVFP